MKQADGEASTDVSELAWYETGTVLAAQLKTYMMRATDIPPALGW